MKELLIAIIIAAIILIAVFSIAFRATGYNSGRDDGYRVGHQEGWSLGSGVNVITDPIKQALILDEGETYGNIVGGGWIDPNRQVKCVIFETESDNSLKLHDNLVAWEETQNTRVVENYYARYNGKYYFIYRYYDMNEPPIAMNYITDVSTSKERFEEMLTNLENYCKERGISASHIDGNQFIDNKVVELGENDSSTNTTKD